MTQALLLPQPAALLGPRGWAAYLAALVGLCVVVPVLNLWVGPESWLHVSDYAVALLGKILCFHSPNFRMQPPRPVHGCRSELAGVKAVATGSIRRLRPTTARPRPLPTSAARRVAVKTQL